LLPENPPNGLGKKRLADACAELDLDTTKIIVELDKLVIIAKPDIQKNR